MSTRRTLSSQTDRAFWRDIYRVAAQELIGRHDGKRNRIRLIAEDAGLHADAAVEQLRQRANQWGRS